MADPITTSAPYRSPFAVLASLEATHGSDKATEIVALKQAGSFLRVARSSFDIEDGTIRDGTGPQDVLEVVEAALELIKRVGGFGKAPQRIFDVFGALLMVSAIIESDIEIECRGVVSPILGALDLAAYSLSDIIEEYEEQEARS